MSIEVETVVAVSVMMAVFSAVAAIGTSIVLGAGFERLRGGMDVIRKQTGFFSDAIQKLEQKMVVVDDQTGKFSHSISVMEAKVNNVGDQANAFTNSIQALEEKVEVVDKQAGFFGNAIHRLEEKVEKVSEHENVISDRLEENADTGLISVGKTEVLVSHAEDLLSQMSTLADQISSEHHVGRAMQYSNVSEDATEHTQAQTHNLSHYTHLPATDSDGMRYN